MFNPRYHSNCETIVSPLSRLYQAFCFYAALRKESTCKMRSILRLGRDRPFGTPHHWLAATANSLKDPHSDRLRHRRCFVIFKSWVYYTPAFLICQDLDEKFLCARRYFFAGRGMGVCGYGYVRAIHESPLRRVFDGCAKRNRAAIVCAGGHRGPPLQICGIRAATGSCGRLIASPTVLWLPDCVGRGLAPAVCRGWNHLTSRRCGCRTYHPPCRHASQESGRALMRA